MCFRPPVVSKKIKCPNCGKEVVIQGNKPQICPHCKANLSSTGKK